MKLHSYCTFFYSICILLYSAVVVNSIDVVTTIPLDVQRVLHKTNISEIRAHLNGSRRIISGLEAHNNRPYMVYLKLPSNNPKYKNYRHWLCGGVIIHDQYVLTSAACIEDAKHFYVVSGTYRHNDEDDRFNNICLKNGAKKAIWKCIPRNYVFDGHENDNIRWMNNDIAIVKVEDEFDFNRRVRGCDFVPRPICYNNQTSRYEDPGNVASIAGWGSTDKYNDWVNKGGSSTSQDLLEADVVIITKNNCKRQWGPRYHSIIDNYMICSRDTIPELSEVCNEKYVECTDIMYSMEESRRVNPSELRLHSAFHNDSGRRQEAGSGGFCENDHGGPLIYGQGSSAIVIGIISACLVKERTNKCYGPYLYTSVYKNRMLINCAIYKDIAGDCTKLFRASDTHIEEHISWADHPDGPAKNEISKMRRTEEEKIKNNTLRSNRTEHKPPLDKVIKHGGVVLRAFDDREDFNESMDNTNSTRSG
ncbi:uncharacterized protein LOC116774738 isoform X1 [Danaus plexippus]|uniref:uncharacterized protein LOC116774738 isoform X1 n=1 Tax=Danaus plexippus TaxID=13037 RepID=UPI0013C4251B|nr:uncharacterized protein LOC116774738 isoform X1 [Danaus plexippus]